MDSKFLTVLGTVSIIAGVIYIFHGIYFPIRISKNDKKKQLVPGLINLGNTCYLNSVLQALASVPAFILWLTSNCNQIKKNNKLTNELAETLQVLNSDRQISHNPMSIFKTLRSHGWVVSLDQQDAHEMLQILTTTLAEEEDSDTKIPFSHQLAEVIDITDNSDKSIVHRSRVSVSKMERKSLSPFTGLFANQFFCKACSKKHSVKFDYFDTISLSLPSFTLKHGACSLQGLFRKFVCSEILDSFECESCDTDTNVETAKTKRRLLKKTSIGKLPQCLCFHINRTYWQNDGSSYKNNMFVSFSETFDIDPFLYTSTDIDSKIPIPGNFQSVFGNVKDEGKIQRTRLPQTKLSINTMYKLFAVVVHHGEVNEGHYVTYRKVQDSQWVYISDEVVQHVSLERVLKSNIYMVFYERK